jgi:hypothetical protein
MMLPRKDTKYIVVTATMTDERLPVREVEWRARKYGYLDAGCHFVIEPKLVTVCRPKEVIGVGARPHNAVSVIIVLSGKPPFTPSQLVSLGETVDAMVQAYPGAIPVAHSDLPGVTRQIAPGFDVQSWWAGWQAQKAIGG